MKYEFSCQTCKKIKTVHRSRKAVEPRFCSFKCRGSTKKFQWKTATEKEIREVVNESFEKNVIKSEGCWGWRGKFDKEGYSILGLANVKYRRAHRVSWFLHYGKIPTGLICHTCTNKDCTNPLHLFVGDPKDNSRDMVEKNIQLKGSKNGNAKLNEEQVKEIKKLLSNGAIYKHIAKSYNVSVTTIAKIRNGKAWNHVA